jgi:hypothetical protein
MQDIIQEGNNQVVLTQRTQTLSPTTTPAARIVIQTNPTNLDKIFRARDVDELTAGRR